MARTTRSQQKHTDDASINTTTSHSSPSKPKSPTKKRKRTSLAPPDDQPATKLPRNDNAADGDVVNDQTQPDAMDQALVDFHGAGDLPLDSQVAQQILDILELSVSYSFCFNRELSSHHRAEQGRHPRSPRSRLSPSHKLLWFFRPAQLPILFSTTELLFPHSLERVIAAYAPRPTSVFPSICFSS